MLDWRYFQVMDEQRLPWHLEEPFGSPPARVTVNAKEMAVLVLIVMCGLLLGDAVSWCAGAHTSWLSGQANAYQLGGLAAAGVAVSALLPRWWRASGVRYRVAWELADRQSRERAAGRAAFYAARTAASRRPD